MQAKQSKQLKVRRELHGGGVEGFDSHLKRLSGWPQDLDHFAVAAAVGFAGSDSVANWRQPSWLGHLARRLLGRAFVGARGLGAADLQD